MGGTFVLSRDVERDVLDWGEMGWISRPSNTGAKELTVMDVSLGPEQGHDFHTHPNQEEVIYVREGQIEQWLETQNELLRAGDAVFIDAGTVHASFNTGGTAALLTVVLAPSIGEGGYELEDVSDQAPWNSLRG